MNRSRWTQFALWVALLSAVPAGAESVPEAEASYKRSLQEYYQAYKAAPVQSAETARQLYKKTVTPAASHLNQSMKMDMTKVFKKDKSVIYPEETRAPASSVEPPSMEPIDSTEFQREIEFNKR